MKPLLRKVLRRLTGATGEQKIFCVGLPKTATTSLSQSLNILGYKTRGFAPALLDDVGQWNFNLIKSELRQADAFRDMPWCFLYRELHEMCPNARFILTLRDEQSWISSFVRHFGDRSMPVLKKGMGTDAPLGKEAFFLEAYRKHNQAVMEYFSKNSSFLVLDASQGLGWDKLCHFLGDPIPDREFPMLRPPPAE